MTYNDIKTELIEHLLLTEMSPICRKFGFILAVFGENLGNPSFHLRYKDEWEVVLQIKDFKILEVKHGPFKKGEYLPNKIQKILVGILKSKGDLGTHWKFLLATWNANNPKYKVNIDLEIPIKG
jgi:hypothetical protein